MPLSSDAQGRRCLAKSFAVGVILCLAAAGCSSRLAEPTELTRAIAAQDRRLVERLLNEGANTNEKALLFPLELAAGHEDFELVRMLLDHGAKLHVRNDDNWSALFSAAQDGPPEAVQLLLAAGADPCATTSASWVRGLRPSEVSKHRGNERVARLLEAAERERCKARTNRAEYLKRARSPRVLRRAEGWATNRGRGYATLLGLDGFRVLDAWEEDDTSELVVVVETVVPVRGCPDCGVVGHVKQRPVVGLRDATSAGRRVRVVWRKRRWVCREPDCGRRSWTEQDDQVGPRRRSTR